MIEENRKKAQKKREKKGTSAKEINRMATTSTRNVEKASEKKLQDKSAVDPAKEEKIRKAHEMGQNAKPGSLTSKANLVSRYNSGQKTEMPALQETTDDKSDKKKNRRKK